MLEKILLLMKQSQTYEKLINNPISKVYGFEALKHEMSGFYSFRLSKRGTIRLICFINKESDVVELIYISVDHCEDFKRILKRKQVINS